MKVTLNSLKGNPVYGNAEMVYNNLVPDESWGRFTSDVYDAGDRVRTGRVGYTSNPGNDMDGVKIKVCRNINNLPDSCSGWSSTANNPVATD
jgi:hypothetical protein